MTAPDFGGSQACAGVDIEVFFPSHSGGARQAIALAKEICSGCAFTDPCLEYALWAQGSSGRFVSGVWGGTTEKERTRLRSQRRRAA